MWIGMLDPLYWVMIGAGILLSAWAGIRVKGTFHRFSQVGTRSGRTGAEIARLILDRNGIRGVEVEPVAGHMTDHYDPTSRTLRLSEPVYASRSISACGVAAHEVGHAIQHAHGYAPLKLRSAWVPVANTGAGLSMLVIMLALFMGGFHTASGSTAATIGLILFGFTTLFTLITLPVEFDASRRALATLEQGGILTMDEMSGARKVLNAAALTYVAAFVTSVLTLLYFMIRLGLFSQRSEE